MRPQDSYRCLNCGSLSGEEASEHSQNWYWRLWEHGKTGPYCSQVCAMSWPSVPADAYTLKQIGDFLVLRVQARHEAENRLARKNTGARTHAPPTE